MEDPLSSSSSADVPSNYLYELKSQEIIQTNMETNMVTNTVAILSPVLKAARSVLTHPVVLFDIGLFLVGQGTIVLPALRSAKWIVVLSRRSFPTIVRRVIRRWGAATRRSSRLVMGMRQHKRMRNIGKTIQCMYKNRSRISVLSDYTWYYNTSSEERIVGDKEEDRLERKGSQLVLEKFRSVAGKNQFLLSV
jgi:hypothetical protein